MKTTSFLMLKISNSYFSPIQDKYRNPLKTVPQILLVIESF